MEEFTDALDVRSLLISIMYRESRFMKKQRNDLETAMETALSRQGWTEGEVDFVVNGIHDEDVSVEDLLNESSFALHEMRREYRLARRRELKSIESLIMACQLNTAYGAASKADQAKERQFLEEMILGEKKVTLRPADPQNVFEWNKYTGNQSHIPDDAESQSLCYPNSKNVKAVHIFGKYNSKLRIDVDGSHEATMERHESIRRKASLGISEDDEAMMRLSVIDFLKTLPIFHRATEGDFFFLQENCYDKRYVLENNRSQQICDSDSMDEVYIIRNGVVDQIEPNKASSTSLAPLVRGAIFPIQQHNDGFVVYRPIGNVDLICINRNILSERPKLDILIEEIICAGNGRSPQEISLSRHLEEFHSHREMISGKKRVFGEPGESSSPDRWAARISVTHNAENQPVMIASHGRERRSILSSTFELPKSGGKVKV